MFRAIANATVAVALLGAAPASAGEGTTASGKVSFYFAAHQDDWQLFMNPSAFQDVIGNAAKTVFIHVTAGDAGLGTGTGDRKHPLIWHGTTVPSRPCVSWRIPRQCRTAARLQ